MGQIARRMASLARQSNTLSQFANSVVRPESLLNTITSRYSLGTNIYESDWDLLVILDTCRVDALQVVSDEYDFLTEVDSIWSVGSCSREWVQKTFVDEYKDQISRTAYVTANPWVERVLDDGQYLEAGWPNWSTLSIDALGHVDHVWKAREENSSRAHLEATSAPEFVTDRAITYAREENPSRMIVHYVPPHHPYVANALSGRSLEPHEKNPFKLLREGHEFNPIWEAYLDELRWALDWVEVLLSNVDAPSTVITSDHGDAFGEYGLYMHDPALLDPNVKRVPWATTTAENEETRTICDTMVDNNTKSVNVEDQLRAMGYL